MKPAARQQPVEVVRTVPAPTTLDLFSGAGGFSLGFQRAGFSVVGAVDVSDAAGRTFRKNFGEPPLACFGAYDGDLRRIPPAELGAALAKAGTTDLDVLIAAPPCQGFSRIGRGKLDWMADRHGAFVLDPRNHLYRQAIAILNEVRPKIFVFENVAGILHVRGENVAERVCDAVSASGYTVRAALLNSAWYGVPQSRERLFIIGVRDDINLVPKFPCRQHTVRVGRGHLSQARISPALWRCPDYFVPFDALPRAEALRGPVTTREAFADLPSFTEHLRCLRTGQRYRPRRESMPPQPYRSPPANRYCDHMRNWPGLPSLVDVTDHYCRWTPRDFETFRRMKPDDRYLEALAIARERYAEACQAHQAGGSSTPPIGDYVPPYPDDCFQEKWRKLAPDQPSHTVTAHLSKDTYSHIHFSRRQARAITIREAARLQSFPDGFVFHGNMGDMFTQIGNAVPPLLGHAIASAVRELLADRLSGWPSAPATLSSGTSGAY